MEVARALAGIGLLVVLTGCLDACGGNTSDSGGSSSSAPTNASKDDFCRTLRNADSHAKPSEVAATMKEVGTPDNISASARRGFEVLVDKMSTLRSSDPSDADIAKMAREFKAGDLTDVQAFITYFVGECAGGLQPSAGAS